jgi:Tol biopolymer transport system component
VPATGSPERVVTTIHLGQTNILQRLAWLSPSELAVADVKPGKSGGLQLYRVVPASGVRELLLAPHEKDAGTDQDPRLSPDGRWLAFARVLGNSAELRVCSAGGGDSRLLATVSGVQGIAWTADSKRIVYYTFEPPGLRDLWQVAPTGGASARASLSFEAGSVDLALSPDGRRAAYVRHTRDTNLWQVFADGASPQKVIASTRADEDGAFSPDGSKIAFSSDRSGVYEIWVADGNGSNARRVTSLDAFSASPMWSPDGRRLAFDSNGNGETRVWTVPADGGAAKALVDESFDAWVPSWSRDGKWIYFCTRKSGSTQIWRAPSDGGTAVRITGKGGFESRESPDGKYLYYSTGDANGIWRLQLDKPGAAEEKFAAFDQALQFRCWDVGATGVFLAPAGGRPRIELMPFSRGSPEFAAFLPVDLPNAGRCLSAHPDGRSFLYPSLDADRQEIYIADLKGR